MESKNLIYIYGVNSVEEAFKIKNALKEIYISKGRIQKLGRIVELAERNSIPLKIVDDSFIEKTVKGVHQGVLAKIRTKKTITIDEALKIPDERKEAASFLILDLVEDPQNFGAILRVADATGVHGVIYQQKRSVGIVPSVWKASAGAIWHVNLIEINNIKYAIRELKDRGILIIATDSKEGEIFWNYNFCNPIAIVLGSEGKGIRHTVRELCDAFIKIPMRGKVSSLNVASACSVILYEALRQRKISLE